MKFSIEFYSLCLCGCAYTLTFSFTHSMFGNPNTNPNCKCNPNPDIFLTVKSGVCSNSQIGTHTHTHPFNGPLSGSTRVSRYQKGKTNMDFTGARDSEWQWHQLGDMQVCTLLQTDNHASTSLLKFLRA